jgi:isopentenyl phosphate kinase
VTPATVSYLTDKIGGSQSIDVTGGMRSKVDEMMRLVQQISTLSVQIFSGEESGNVVKALSGEMLDTLINCD